MIRGFICNGLRKKLCLCMLTVVLANELLDAYLTGGIYIYLELAVGIYIEISI